MRKILLTILLLFAFLSIDPRVQAGIFGSCSEMTTDRGNERADRQEERKAWTHVFDKLQTSTTCVTDETLLRKQIELEYREKALESAKASAIQTINQAVKSATQKCYLKTKDYIEFSACIEAIGLK